MSLATCPNCGDLCHPTLSRCEACGAHLYPSTTTAPARTTCDGKREQGPTGGTLMPKDCTCGGRQICTACVLESYENDPFSRSVDAVLHSMRPDPEPNVIPMRRREPTDDEIYNRPGVEGGIAYPLTDDGPGSLGENDWRL